MTSFDELLNNKPTLEWKERMDEEDDIFTEENIRAADQVLNHYMTRLKALTNPSQEEVMECVEEVVISLNELNEKYDYFIETEEREELCEFIDEAAQLAGVHSDEDITEEWREW
ncbi:uncharacterized protein YsxB (DUF464 family) [Bacillus ectoiniformans]|uniref:hypothetical protein n=1 Tax=Bacillus ectoiniformans TaxID=1494429 RepID=UPI00195721DE|nr:hypothetical protein [Bacillus ectoiniformans]MBM7650199.1 uncharacterized protein YsxB (DUF464 family) [Bacillus ectoiniformans]